MHNLELAFSCAQATVGVEQQITGTHIEVSLSEKITGTALAEEKLV